MTSIIEWMDRTFYPGYVPKGDHRIFRDELLKCIGRGSTVLEIGAGRGATDDFYDFSGTAEQVCGIDPDPIVAENPHLHEFRVASAERIPYADATFDVAFAVHVMEHVADPAAAFSEIARVLKPGGVFLAMTPNICHYVTLISRLTPFRFHRFTGRMLNSHEQDMFPTYYRCNSESRVRRLAKQAGLKVAEFHHFELWPGYLKMSALTYAPGIFYERFVSRFEWAKQLRLGMIFKVEKPNVSAYECRASRA